MVGALTTRKKVWTLPGALESQRRALSRGWHVVSLMLYIVCLIARKVGSQGGQPLRVGEGGEARTRAEATGKEHRDRHSGSGLIRPGLVADRLWDEAWTPGLGDGSTVGAPYVKVGVRWPDQVLMGESSGCTCRPGNQDMDPS